MNWSEKMAVPPTVKIVMAQMELTKVKLFTSFFFLISSLMISTFCLAIEVKIKNHPLPPRYDECQNCHGKKTYSFIQKSEKNTLEHQNISLKHGKKEMSCNLCHDKNNHNFLFQSVGQNDFTRTSLVCQTCHSDVIRKWKAGTHGKRIEGWKNQLQLQCIDCHNPHSVSFPKMKADPPPPKPKFSIPKSEGHHEG